MQTAPLRHGLLAHSLISKNGKKIQLFMLDFAGKDKHLHYININKIQARIIIDLQLKGYLKIVLWDKALVKAHKFAIVLNACISLLNHFFLPFAGNKSYSFSPLCVPKIAL